MILSNLEKRNQIAMAQTSWGITPKDMGVPSRKVNYWKSQNLLPYIIDGKHLKMNIYQAMWFRVVDKLSEFGVSSELIFKLGKAVWSEQSTFDSNVRREFENPHSKLLPEQKAQLVSLTNDPVGRIALAQEQNAFTDGLASVVGSKPRCMDFNYFPKSNTWAFTGKVLPTAADQYELFEDEPRIVIPLATKFNELIAKELMETGTCNSHIEENLSEMLDIVYRKKPQYVDVVIHGETKEFVCVYETTKSIEEIIRYVSENDIASGSSMVMTKRNASHYKFQIITKTK